jgi:purine-binding chemotaxis protein CheW
VVPQLLRFDLSGHHFALRSEVVREITRALTISPLPKAPAIVEGLINVRGRLVPVLDIRSRFGLPRCELSPDQHFVIADTAPRRVALRVDRALDLVDVNVDAIESAEAAVPGAALVAGVAKLPDGLLVIHDLEGFLSLDESAQVEAALARAGAPGRTPAGG